MKEGFETTLREDKHSFQTHVVDWLLVAQRSCYMDNLAKRILGLTVAVAVAVVATNTIGKVT